MKEDQVGKSDCLSHDTQPGCASVHSTQMKTRFLAPQYVVLLLAWSSLGFSQTPPNTVAHQDSSKWEKEIAAFESSDQTNRPPKDCIVFVGSSSIRLWSTLKQDFDGLPVVNRGFGGSELADAVNLADRIIIPYSPREVVIYSGANDLANGKAPELVFGDFVALVTKIQQSLPHTRIAFIASAPNPKRWAIVEKVQKLNALAEEYCRQHGLVFIDVFSLMLGTDGQPKSDIFREDRLHMNAKGYAIWIEAVRPYLK
jgi:lysophospholipase L1-like esterase